MSSKIFWKHRNKRVFHHLKYSQGLESIEGGMVDGNTKYQSNFYIISVKKARLKNITHAN